MGAVTKPADEAHKRRLAGRGAAVGILVLALAQAGIYGGWVFAGLTACLLLYVLRRVTEPLADQVDDLVEEVEDLRLRLSHSERHDPLTGLANRRLLAEFLALALAEAGRHGEQVALCMLDLTGLRRLGETCGPAAVDEALRRAAGLVQSNTRKGDLVARAGPAQFALVVTRAPGAQDLHSLAGRLSSAIRAPFQVGEAEAQTGCFAGVVLAPRGEEDPAQLIANGLTTARAARRRGSACELFTPELAEELQTSIRIRAELLNALEHGEIEPWFQPLVRARDGAVTGFEALARWRHPEKGVLSPAIFLPVAEEFGLLDRLDEAILDKALDALVAWRAEGLEAPCVSVNLAAGRLADGFLVERIRWALEKRDLEPGDLVVEILESVLIDAPDDLIGKSVDALSRLGVSVVIDDFGTGHASISSLRRVRADYIKIDRSFVSRVDTDKGQHEVIGAMISMAKGLGVATLAEGVETEGERAALLRLGCDMLQGYGVARPMPGADVPAWITARGAARRRA